MYITDKLINFLNKSSMMSHSTIILTDLDNVVFASPDDKSTYLNNHISNDLQSFLKLFSQDVSSVDYINTSMTDIVPIILNDDVSKYKSQIILPIVHNNSIDGLLIFMTCDRFYIESNLKFAKTTKHFVELLGYSNFS